MPDEDAAVGIPTRVDQHALIASHQLGWIAKILMDRSLISVRRLLGRPHGENRGVVLHTQNNSPTRLVAALHWWAGPCSNIEGFEIADVAGDRPDAAGGIAGS